MSERDEERPVNVWALTAAIAAIFGAIAIGEWAEAWRDRGLQSLQRACITARGNWDGSKCVFGGGK